MVPGIPPTIGMPSLPLRPVKGLSTIDTARKFLGDADSDLAKVATVGDPAGEMMAWSTRFLSLSNDPDMLKTIEKVLVSGDHHLDFSGREEALGLIRLSIDSELKALELRNQQTEIMRRAEALAGKPVAIKPDLPPRHISPPAFATPGNLRSPVKVVERHNNNKSPEEAPKKKKSARSRSKSASPGRTRQMQSKSLRDAAFITVRKAGVDAEDPTIVDWLKPIRDCELDVPMLQAIESVAAELRVSPNRLSVGGMPT